MQTDLASGEAIAPVLRAELEALHERLAAATAAAGIAGLSLRVRLGNLVGHLEGAPGTPRVDVRRADPSPVPPLRGQP